MESTAKPEVDPTPRPAQRHRIAVLQGHPDPHGGHYCHALADAYIKGAVEGGHAIRTVVVAGLDFPLVQSKDDWENNPPPASIRNAQEVIHWANHLVIIYPLWLGSMPALLKAFLEQVMRPGFAVARSVDGFESAKLLRGRSARVVLTMGMPAPLYRLYYRAHSLRSLERNILDFCGIEPIRESLIGMIEAPSPAGRRKWLGRLEKLGRAGT